MQEILVNKMRMLFRNHPNLLGKPATQKEISDAENILGLKFNETYIEFIMLFGGAFGGFAISAFSNGPSIGNNTVIDLTKSFRIAYNNDNSPELNNLYAISDDGTGNPILMNTKGSVFLYLHEEGELNLLYDSLVDLFNKSFP